MNLPISTAPTASAVPMSFDAAVIDLLFAFVLGSATAWLYGRTHRGASYSRNMVQSLVLLCMIVSMVMLVVGDSIARAFGLVGALAIIRFRTVVRDARDTTFIFLVLAVGIAIGAHQYALALAGTVTIGVTVVLLHVSNFGTRSPNTGVLRVWGARAATSELTPILEGSCKSHELLAADEGAIGEAEYSYRIRLRGPTERQRLIETVRTISGISRVTVALDEEAEEW